MIYAAAPKHSGTRMVHEPAELTPQTILVTHATACAEHPKCDIKQSI